MLTSFRTSESMWNTFPLLLQIRPPPTSILLCPQKADQCGLPPSPLSHTHLEFRSENIGRKETLARDLPKEEELDHGIYAQILSHPGGDPTMKSLSFSPPLGLPDPEVVTGPSCC